MKTGMVVLITALAVVGVGATGLVIANRNQGGPAYTADAKIASRPQYTRVTLAGGAATKVKLLTALSSESSQIGDAVAAVLVAPWVVNGMTALPAGTRIEGSVTNAESTGRLKHNAKLAFRFDRAVLPNGERVSIVSRTHSLEAGGETERDVITIGAGTAAGAIIGALTGNTTRGAVVGAGVGTGAALAHKGDPVGLPAGSILSLTLKESLDVSVRKGRA